MAYVAAFYFSPLTISSDSTDVCESYCGVNHIPQRSSLPSSTFMNLEMPSTRQIHHSVWIVHYPNLSQPLQVLPIHQLYGCAQEG